jgi:hypothetical protein
MAYFCTHPTKLVKNIYECVSLSHFSTPLFLLLVHSLSFEKFSPSYEVRRPPRLSLPPAALSPPQEAAPPMQGVPLLGAQSLFAAVQFPLRRSAPPTASLLALTPSFSVLTGLIVKREGVSKCVRRPRESKKIHRPPSRCRERHARGRRSVKKAVVFDIYCQKRR